MFERRATQRGRTLIGAKLVFNAGRSAIDCVMRNVSEDGACVQVESTAGIPDNVLLHLNGESVPRTCAVTWRSSTRMGLDFQQPATENKIIPEQEEIQTGQPELIRGELLSLRSALDEVKFGIVLLDSELRAQYINKAFRKMWRLPDSKADAKPAFVALMYHGRDTKAYKVPDDQLDNYVAERVALVRAGDVTPRDLRLTSGEIIRLQCAVLPNGGRMLSYTYVTDIIQQSDRLEVMNTALNSTQEGIILLDADLNAEFMNQAVRQLWDVPNEVADSTPHYTQLVSDARRSGVYGVRPENLEQLIAKRIALVRAGDPTPHDLKTSDGRHIRTRCAVLPNGGRMLTYWDVTDLVRHAKQLELLATFDSMTGLYNRRHFLSLANAEWNRFQRYHRPLTMLILDIDHFKLVNDRYGHATGDEALIWVAKVCSESRRTPDIIGRVGGEEFGLLLPETDETQAAALAERIRSRISGRLFSHAKGDFTVTVSIGLASATLSMSGVTALMDSADQALYSAKSNGRNKVVLFKPPCEAEEKLAAE